MDINMIKNKLFVNLIVLVIFSVGFTGRVFADSIYGGGEVVNKSFRIEKHVRFVDNGTWKDKITGVTEGRVFEFRIKITNTGELKTNDMSVKDIFPSELEIVEGDFSATDLIKKFEDFKPGDVEEYTFLAKVKNNQFDREDDFEKCVVNKAEVSYKDKFEGSDTATVCYGKGEVAELPKTGAGATLGVTLAGMSLIFAGFFSKRKRA
jgi:LPXTG-motif cell wall-anchored protein/uncharacterized repeat protein (TIGR01451 family)